MVYSKRISALPITTRKFGLGAAVLFVTACAGSNADQTIRAADGAAYAACIGYTEYDIAQPVPPVADGILAGIPPRDILLADTQDQFDALANRSTAAETAQYQAIRTDARAVGRPRLSAENARALDTRCTELDQKYRP